jgi:hypothetical protein
LVGQEAPKPARNLGQLSAIGHGLSSVALSQVVSDSLQVKVDTFKRCSDRAGHRARGRRLAIGLTILTGIYGGTGFLGFRGRLTVGFVGMSFS